MRTHPFKADLLLILVTLLAALSWIFSKEVLVGLPPMLFMGLRFFTAGLLLAAFSIGDLRRFHARDTGRVFLVGAVFAVGITFWVFGLHLGTHMGVGGFLTSMGALLAPLIAIFFGERAGRALWLALPIACAGLAALSLDSHFVFGIGEWSYLASALFFATFINLSARAAVKTSVIALTAIQLVTVGLLLIPISWFFENWELVNMYGIWGWFAASALLGSAARFLIQTYSFKLAPAGHGALVLTLEPVWVAIFAAIWYGERMEPMQLLGCLLIFIAVLTTRAKSIYAYAQALRQAKQAR